MKDIVEDLSTWHAAGERFALATVVRTWKSSPRQPGASMAVSERGEVAGSVSGGCVEGALYELAQEVFSTGEPALETYGVSDDDAFTVGLTCGGILEVFVQAVDSTTFPHLGDVLAAAGGRRELAVATVIAGPGRVGSHLIVSADQVQGTLGSAGLDHGVIEHARGSLVHGSTGVIHVGRHGEQRVDELAVFIDSYISPPLMLVFGAIDFARAVVRIGKFLGYHVVLCDARAVFATVKRFPDADEVVVAWPHQYLERDDVTVDERTVICVLTHDPKFDVPLLQVALRTNAAYIGAMGSRRTHDDRLARLRELGMDDETLARLSSPTGLDLGARTPEETAVSIGAEIIAKTWGGTGQPLGTMREAIHR